MGWVVLAGAGGSGYPNTVQKPSTLFHKHCRRFSISVSKANSPKLCFFIPLAFLRQYFQYECNDLLLCVYLCLSMCTNNHNSEQFIKSIPRYHHHRYLLLCYTKSTPIFFYGTDFHIQTAENVHENGVNKSLLELPTTGRYTQRLYIPYSCSVITKGQIDKQKSRRYKPHK